MFTQVSKNNEDWLTAKEVMAWLKVSKTTLWRWEKVGLKAYRVGRVKRYRKPDVEAFLNRHGVADDNIGAIAA